MSNIKIGICVPPEQAELAQKMGFDYFEPSFASVAAMSDGEFDAMEKLCARLGFRAEAMNCMMTGQFRLTGPNADLEPVKGYIDKTMDRAARVGCTRVVFGSSGARNLPDGFDRGTAWEQLADFLTMASDYAVKHGIDIVIEPLRFGESNIINLVSEGAYLARRVNMPGIRCLADYYHMQMNCERGSEVLGLGSLLEHCHIARKEGRFFPLPGDGHDYASFFDALKAIGYSERVSIEGNTERGFDIDAPASLAYLRTFAD